MNTKSEQSKNENQTNHWTEHLLVKPHRLVQWKSIITPKAQQGNAPSPATPHLILHSLSRRPLSPHSLPYVGQGALRILLSVSGVALEAACWLLCPHACLL